MLKEFTDKTVPVFGLIDNGELFLVGKYKTCEELFANEKKLILKPRMGRGGEGVILVTAVEGKVFLNNKMCEDFNQAVKNIKNYILVPYVNPHPYSAKIFPDSLNTIRLLTCVLDGKVILLRAGHRFGVDPATNVDNVCHGGISTKVNIGTGFLEDPILIDQKHRKKITAEVHPVTKERILGVEIPRWHEVKNSVIKLHEDIKFIKYVGWDIAITHDDYRIIEANYASDLDAPQLHSPLLIDDENKKFFAKLN
jgi:hypothetical protein